MDYSLIVGIHDIEKAEEEAKECPPSVEENGEEEEVEEEVDDVDQLPDDIPTPPDSPSPYVTNPFSGEMDPILEKYAIKSSEGKLSATLCWKCM